MFIFSRVAGHAKIKVESRSDEAESFGRGREISTTFGEFLHSMNAGNVLQYLSTQDLNISADGQPDIISPPVTYLHSDFPLRPSIMGNLIPQNINLWAGSTGPKGSSSGLHHDYHDNLYILLRGSKRFLLWSPDSAPSMYTQGKLAKIHTNGRINYVGQLTRADGADVDADDALDKANEVDKRAIEAELAAAEEAMQNGETGAKERLLAAEQAFENALESVLDAEFGNSDIQGASFEDYPSLSEYRSSEESSYDELIDSESEENEDELISKVSSGKRKHSISPVESHKKNANSFGESKFPDNFSKVNLELAEMEMKEIYPLFSILNRCEVTVRPGEILYLPAGWFHEVRSYNGNTKSDDKPGHMAFNYWFHPPDTNGSFEAPYISKLWEMDWNKRIQSRGMQGLYSGC